MAFSVCLNFCMADAQKLPRLRRCNPKGKITVYPEKEIENLYYLGQGNGWDTPRIVREAITDALTALADKLKQPANQP
jgi:hypothetical protein